jgi:cell division protein ZipA
VLLIIAVLLDGYRRMRDPNRIRVSLTRVPEGDGNGDDEDVFVTRELPHGGARVKPRGTESQQAGDAFVQPDSEPAIGKGGSADFEPAPAEEAPLSAEPLSAGGRIGAGRDPDPLFDDPMPAVGSGPRTAARPGENLDLLDGITADSRDEISLTDGKSEAEEVLMLHVVARDPAGFSGEDILQVLLAYNLRFGEMNFFHRHEESAGRGAIQFSVANMLNPGVFDIDAMSDFSTTGLIFFLALPGPRNMIGAFERMVETAKGVAADLGGDVLDESRSAVTRQTLEHMRQRIRDFERKMLAAARR